MAGTPIYIKPCVVRINFTWSNYFGIIPSHILFFEVKKRVSDRARDHKLLLQSKILITEKTPLDQFKVILYTHL